MAPETLPNKRGGHIYSGTVHCICAALLCAALPTPRQPTAHIAHQPTRPCVRAVQPVQSVYQSASLYQSEHCRPQTATTTADTGWHWTFAKSPAVLLIGSTQCPSFYPLAGRSSVPPSPRPPANSRSQEFWTWPRVELCLTGLLSVPPAHSTRLGSSIHRLVHSLPRPSVHPSILPCSTPTTGFSAAATAYTPCRQNSAQSCRTAWRSWTRN